MRITKGFVTLLIAFLLSFSQLGLASDGWDAAGGKKGVNLFTKTYAGESLKAFRGTKVFNKSIKQIYWVLSQKDPNFRKEWVDRLYISEPLEDAKSLGVPHSSVTYQAYDTPWPITNRDQVVKTQTERDGKNLIVTLKSTTHGKKPAADSVGVRMDLLFAIYNLKYLEDNKTEVTVSVRIDPKGLIPNWFSNIIYKSWPVNTLNRLERQASKYSGQNVSMP
tara:strand:+ start:6761 stop:7423 length:663 start_codon:yes stop_codon:yes gene_type:complete